DLGARVTLDGAKRAPIHVTARFAEYQAEWNISEANLKPGPYIQPMTPVLPALASAHNTGKDQVSEPDAGKQGNRKPLVAALPTLMLRYHFEVTDNNPHREAGPTLERLRGQQSY